MLEDCPGANIFLSRLSHIALFRTPFFFWLFQNPKTNAKTELSRPRLTFWGLWQFLTSGQFSTQEVNPTSTACSLPFRPASKPTATGGVSFGSWTNSPPGQSFGSQSTPPGRPAQGMCPPSPTRRTRTRTACATTSAWRCSAASPCSPPPAGRWASTCPGRQTQRLSDFMCHAKIFPATPPAVRLKPNPTGS